VSSSRSWTFSDLEPASREKMVSINVEDDVQSTKTYASWQNVSYSSKYRRFVDSEPTLRKKRVSRNMYSMVKSSLRKSFGWIKDKYTQVVS
jgi:hypothetical protein